MKTLIVEDNADDRRALRYYLERHGCDVIEARDGEEALDYLFCRGKYAGGVCEELAVILLDIKLPKVDGLEVLRTIKSADRLKLIPVVILTSSREERDPVESYRLGVNAFVVKPVDFGEFMNAVKELGVFWAIINEPLPPGSKREMRK